MATLEELKRKFIQADRAGDTRSAQIFANEIRKLQSQQKTAVDRPIRDIGAMMPIAGSPSELGRAMAEAVAPEETARARRYIGGLGREALEGLTLGGIGELQAAGAGALGAMTGEGFAPAFKESLAESERKSKEFREEFPVSSVAAQVAGSLPTGIAGAGRIAATKLGAKMPIRMQALGAGAMGGTAGLLGTEGDVGDRALGAGIGAGLGTVLGASGEALPRVLPQARELMSKGVPLTVGESMGGLIKQSEELAKRMPYVREMIRGAEKRSAQGFSKAAIDDALAPIGYSSPADKVGRDAIDHASEAISDAYDKAIPKAGLPNATPLWNRMTEIIKENDDLVGDAYKSLRARLRKAVDPSLFKDDLSMTGQDIRKAEKYLGTTGRKLTKSQDTDKQQIGYALLKMQSALRQELAKQNPDSKALANANKAFAQFQPVFKASISRPTQEGVFTPAQYLSTIKQSDPRKFGRGVVGTQELAETAQKLTAKELPDSGTPAGAFAALFAASPAQAAAMLAPAIPIGLTYTSKAGQDIARGLLSSPAAITGIGARLPIVSGGAGSLLAGE